MSRIGTAATQHPIAADAAAIAATSHSAAGTSATTAAADPASTLKCLGHHRRPRHLVNIPLLLVEILPRFERQQQFMSAMISQGDLHVTRWTNVDSNFQKFVARSRQIVTSAHLSMLILYDLYFDGIDDVDDEHVGDFNAFSPGYSQYLAFSFGGRLGGLGDNGQHGNYERVEHELLEQCGQVATLVECFSWLQRCDECIEQLEELCCAKRPRLIIGYRQSAVARIARLTGAKLELERRFVHIGSEYASDEYASDNERSLVWREIDAAFESHIFIITKNSEIYRCTDMRECWSKRQLRIQRNRKSCAARQRVLLEVTQNHDRDNIVIKIKCRCSSHQIPVNAWLVPIESRNYFRHGKLFFVAFREIRIWFLSLISPTSQYLGYTRISKVRDSYQTENLPKCARWVHLLCCVAETVRILKRNMGRDRAPTEGAIRKLVRKVREKGMLVDDRSGPRARTVRTPENIEAVAQILVVLELIRSVLQVMGSTFINEGKYFHNNSLEGMIAACFLYSDALEIHVLVSDLAVKRRAVVKEK
ncbi:hypothetical protein G5I_01481 [Acromyrmex echinatior]|uniref:DUF4817 domain-containing protein n=1 Tax=Acromyrmex echinatior TaxID=103372 RepID=F4W7R0_ACREC|nr:hypothetical protein G5I_01481 [Acromyrmex echinatior]